MKKQVGIYAALLLGAVSTPALADEPTYGLYTTVTGGVGLLDSITPSSTLPTTDTKFKDGYMTSAAIGWGLGNGFRPELEIGWHANDVKRGFTQNSLATGFVLNGGRATQLTFMGNLLYDIQTGTNWTPHLGVGIGVDSGRVEGVNIPAGNAPIDTHGTVFAYQGIAGLEYAIAPSFHVGLEYRHMGTSSIQIAGNPAALGSSYTFNSNDILATMRFSFGTAPAAPVAVAAAAAVAPVTPPPAPVAKAPEVQRAFQVFFDFNKFDVTAAAAKVIQAAADNVKAGNVTRIAVTGHTDTVGSAKYNQALSERRAAAVKQQLIADGVGAGEITATGVGKTGLLVPTADGVREPQNRRAEIVLQ
jgi:OOP family OmpA-OmpF porin